MENKSLNDCSKNELIRIINSLKKQKKFGLVWEDKPEKVATECEQKLPVLKEADEKVINEADDSTPTNIIIEGDNYHALSALNYTHAGKIDVIYIDPPYNTGNKDFAFNDKFVDKEDAFFHSKWLSFMSKRLALAKSLLTEHGIILISINDEEMATLKLLCNQIFGEENYIENFIWVKNSGGSLSKTTLTRHEYILCFAKNKQVVLNDAFFFMKKPGYDDIIALVDKCKKRGTKREIAEKEIRQFYKAHNELKGISLYDSIDEDFKVYRCLPITAPNNNFYDVLHPITGKPVKTPPRGWSWSKETMAKKIKEGRVVFGKDENYVPSQKLYLEEAKFEHKRSTIDSDQAEGNKSLAAILGVNNKFRNSNPKPISLLKYLLQNTDSNAIILDFFAGSGTTGQAVSELNQEDGGNRQFILCTNNENQIAEDVTYPRIKTVVTGIREDGSKYSDGIPANVRYFKTDFVEKDETLDKLRRKLSPACEDMIRIREGAYEKIIDEDMLKVYKNSRGLTAIIYDRFELKEHLAKIEELETDEPIHLYVFSYTKYDRLDEIEKPLKHTYISQPIPEGVLEIYKRIFNQKGGKR